MKQEEPHTLHHLLWLSVASGYLKRAWGCHCLMHHKQLWKRVSREAGDEWQSSDSNPLLSNVATLVTIAKAETAQMPLTDEWTNKMSYSHTVDYYSAVKKNAMTLATTWMSFENIVQSETNKQTNPARQQSVYCMPVFTCNVWTFVWRIRRKRK